MSKRNWTKREVERRQERGTPALQAAPKKLNKAAAERARIDNLVAQLNK